MMRAFDLVWADRKTSSFGGDEDQKEYLSEKILNDDAWRQELQSRLMDIFVANDSVETGILMDQPAMNFIT